MRKFQLRVVLLFICDLITIYIAYASAALLIEDFQFHKIEINRFFDNAYWLVPLYIISFVLFKLYKSLWRYASIEEGINVFLSVIAPFVITMFVNLFIPNNLEYNTIILSNILLFLGLMAVRYSYRILRILVSNDKLPGRRIRTLVIGAGHAGNLIIKEFKSNPKINNKVVCFVDDDKGKIGKIIQGIRVCGSLNDIAKIVDKEQIEEIIVAIPSASRKDIQKVLKNCENLKVKIKMLPPFYEVIDKNFNLNEIRDVQIEDLLGRDEIKIDDDGIKDFIKNEVVLVTGGGGSIGSELCRQIIKYNPKTLIIFDIYENNAYDIQNELLRYFQHHNITNINLEVLIGSVQDEKRLEEVFEKFRPTIVFHAAAHKHVPLMEVSPKEAIKNNIFGTYNVAKASDKYSVKKFVLISTDKAVNPTNIMGATKRFAEMIIQAFNHESKTQYAAVRFGNVLGSNGSVIPLFKKQIQDGGPVTVTHKDIIRYFMTIPEAVQLVLQAGTFAEGGEIFVLDMGEPMKILDLAERIIRFSGYEPYSEIEIKFTGLRPGEKLYEELLLKEEGLLKTHNDKIFVSQVNGVNLLGIEKNLADLRNVLNKTDIQIQEIFSQFVSTYNLKDVS